MCATLVMIGLAVLGTTTAASLETLPDTLNLDTIRAVPVQHNGRCMPIDTLARDLVDSITDREFFHGRDPVTWLLAWSFDPQGWKARPLIRIANQELRGELGLSSSQTVFSFSELASHPRLHDLIEGLSHSEPGHKPDPLESKVQDINDKLLLLQRVFEGQAIRLIPDPASSLNAWTPIPPADADAEAGEDSDPVRAAWAAVGQAFLADDREGFDTACEKLGRALAALPAAYRPVAAAIDRELGYNRLRPFRTAGWLMAGGALLSACGLAVRRRWFDVLSSLGMLAGFLVATYGLSLRWGIAGRIPASNMYESLLFLSWGMGAFAVVSMFALKHRLVPFTASAMGALALLLAEGLPIDRFVRPIAPVLLDTVWMSIHVPIIMLSYSVLALGVLIAHVQVASLAIAPSRRRLSDTLDSLHYWYISIGSILLIAGIITGSMWAASSWGRYWGWDPKEVWSLVAFLGYMAILHVRLDREHTPGWVHALAAALSVALLCLLGMKLAPLTSGKLMALAGAGAAMAIFVLARGPFATATKSILAFWLIIMTYVGVNYVLGIGLHSYGFGTGAVVRYMFGLGGIDLGLVALCCMVYLWRSGWRPTVPAPHAVAHPA